jgi:molecular chaperone GrpE (heat shock protein)
MLQEHRQLTGSYMSQHDGPPTLISDEWQQRNEPAQSSAAETDVADSSKSELDPDTTSESAELDPEAPEETLLLSDLPEQSDDRRQSEPPVEPAPDHLALIEAELSALRGETAHVNKILDRLHAENERLRRGESEQILQPLFRDLMKLADDWTAMGASWESKETATPADVARKCRDVADDAGLILARHGVDSFTPSIGSPIERKQHRVIGTVDTETPELDNTVAEVRRIGYVYGEKVLKFAEVIAARHER